MSKSDALARWCAVFALVTIAAGLVAACARSAVPDDEAALAAYRRLAAQEPGPLRIDGAPVVRRWSFGELPTEGGAVPAPRVAWDGRVRPEWTPPPYEGTDFATAMEGPEHAFRLGSSGDRNDRTTAGAGARDELSPDEEPDAFVLGRQADGTIRSPSSRVPVSYTPSRRAMEDPVAGLQCVARELLRANAPYPHETPSSPMLPDQVAAACGSGLHPRYLFTETYSGHEATPPTWSHLNGRAEATCGQGNPYGAAWMDHPAGPRSMIVCDTPLMQLRPLQRTGVRDGFEVRATPRGRLRDARVRVEQDGRMRRCERHLLIDNGELVWSCPFDEALEHGVVVLEARPFRSGWYSYVGSVTVTSGEALRDAFELPDVDVPLDASMEQLLVDQANALRGEAGLGRLEIAVDEQEIRALAHARIFDGTVTEEEFQLLVQGAESGWLIPGEMARRAHLVMAFSEASPEDIVGAILASPRARATMLDDAWSHIVVSQIGTDDATAVWISLHGSRPSEHDQAAALLNEVVARRAALGRSTTVLSDAEQRYIEGRADAMTTHNLEPMRARDHMRLRLPRLGEGTVWVDAWGFVEDIEDALIPESVLAPDHIALSLAIGSWRGPDDLHSRRYALVAWRER